MLLDNSSLKYTKTFDLAIPRHSRKDTGYTEGELSELYNKGVQALLASMPGLTYFSWEDVTLYTTTISTLHQKCPNIRSLIIHNEEHIEEKLGLIDNFDFNDGFHERQALFATQDLSLFSNLAELEVYGIYGDLNRVRKDLVEVLLKSPTLRTLGLSISADTVERLNFEGTVAKNMEYLLFSKALCDEYVAAGGRPLRLQKLVFGLSLIVWQPGSYLASLVDLESLEDAYISNQGHDVAIYFQEEDNIAWSLFTPNQCPNLSTFGVHDVTKRVKRWVDALEPGYIRQFRTEWSTEYDLNDVVSKLEGAHTSSKSKMSMVTSQTDDFQLVKIRGVQALAINIRSPHQEIN
ncbi:uncharacterized protein BP5553_06161 [Venustampulla echinocandica]|uniref:Uncharacterized protein n=1 Tax=Venustampulla echinocandica TaxID=2656787 RepID=A0A370TMQ9_9HELO|nr:uncharacterized protein BP5553_06161 [Venustampulla echinocandica]RDL36809.1 hypothetical protein BP5553_06161 [Venustampulla echinocandica]